MHPYDRANQINKHLPMPFDSPLVPLCKNEHLLDKGRKIARAERVKKRNSRQLEDSTRRISPIR